MLIGKLSDADIGGHGLSLLHADADLLVFDKPSGLLSVPGRGADKQDCMAARAQRLYPDALVVHRLDMATSGLWLMARGADMQRRMSNAFAQREVVKRYVAVVAGRLETPASSTDGWSLIDLPLAADWPNRPRRIVDPEKGKPSQTRWRVLEFLPSPPGEGSGAPKKLASWGAGGGGGTTRLELEPLTGRSHQLRVHLQALGYPILGDGLYAPPEVQAQSSRLLLHATELRFKHPTTGEALAFSSACPF